jgi:hypothetical protein
MLDRFTNYFANLSPGAQVTTLGVLSLFLVSKR